MAKKYYSSCPNCGCTTKLTEVLLCHECGAIVCEVCSGLTTLKCPICRANVANADSMGMIKPGA